MRHSHLSLPPRLRWAFYLAIAILFGTGAAWWLVQLATDGEALTSGTRALLPWLLKVHGAAAMFALVIVGVIYPLHITRGWRLRRNRFWGVVLSVATILLVATAYLLYYASGEGLRAAASSIHLWVGLFLPVIIVWHIRSGRSAS